MQPKTISDLVPRTMHVPQLSVLLDRIQSVYEPEDVLLFGSRARGTAGPDSDWDIIVILNDSADESLLDHVLGWKTQRGSGVYADVLCSFKSEFIADLAVANSRTREVVDHAVRITAR